MKISIILFLLEIKYEIEKSMIEIKYWFLRRI